MDRQVLERLFRDARIGDTLVLPITDSRGQTRQKEYRLVGVLQPQFQGDSGLEDYLPQGTLSLPRVLLGSPEDFAPICRHIVFTFPLGGSLEKCKESYPNASFLGIDSAGALYEDQPLYNSFSALKEQNQHGLFPDSGRLRPAACLTAWHFQRRIRPVLPERGAIPDAQDHRGHPAAESGPSAAGRRFF